jgi:succinyl-CoA synthetase beta subunit
MNLHEYQAKQVLASYGVPVPKGIVANSGAEAEAAAQSLGGSVWVVKAQVHAGGRGKAGGVKLARDGAAVRAAAEGMLGQRLVTKQTGAGGLPIEKVYVETGSAIAREIYLSLTLNRERGRIAVVASTEGGMDIETVAEETPEKILSVLVHPATGLQSYQCRQLGFALGLNDAQRKQFESIVRALYQLYMDKDASLIEINPLIVTGEGNLVALDCKLDIEANAMFRQKDMAAYRDRGQEDPAELRASDNDLNYVSLDGNIACMVNGAGLAMATMDVIKLHGGQPANFLDVGGGVTVERGIAAFDLILSNPSVKAILVNVFGGIVRCDTVAQAVITAFQKVGVKVPVVVRLEGTNAEQARKMLKDSGLALIPAEGLTDAAKKVVAAAAAK